MGLDMYAARRVYTKQWDHQSPEERYKVQIARGGKPVPGIETDRISGVEEEVMYWRKANHIHGWFVNNVQAGHDDCKEYYVDEDNLLALYDACEQVIEASKLVDGQVYTGTEYSVEHPQGMTQFMAGKVIEDSAVAEDLLPVRDGFFFGSQGYDEDYLQDVIETRDWIARMIADRKAGVPGEIYYSSSW